MNENLTKIKQKGHSNFGQEQKRRAKIGKSKNFSEDKFTKSVEKSHEKKIAIGMFLFQFCFWPKILFNFLLKKIYQKVVKKKWI